MTVAVCISLMKASFVACAPVIGETSSHEATADSSLLADGRLKHDGFHLLPCNIALK
jgi:hypothetical protein